MNLREAKFASIDLETTGLNVEKDEIIAIGIVPIQGLTILASQSFYSLVKSKRSALKAMKIHGISDDILKNAPSFEEISEKVYEMLRDRILVGFCIKLDYDFLKKALKGFEAKTIDVLRVDRILGKFLGEKYAESPSLDALAKKYGIKTTYRHNALADAFITAQIFQFQLIRLLKTGTNTVEKLLAMIEKESEEHPII
ncbi:MAG: 3'-5' exonuclease [Archaeoglobaceae archaeon]